MGSILHRVRAGDRNRPDACCRASRLSSSDGCGTQCQAHDKYYELGRYNFTALPPGRYTLSFEATGFQKAGVPAFTLDVQQQATVDMEMQVGQMSTAIEVQSTVTLLNTTAATNGQVVGNRTIQTAPLQSRNPMALVMLTAGVVLVESEAGGADSVNFVASGNRNSTSEVVLDGAAISGVEQNSSITDLKYTPSVDVIEEFKIQTNFFSAEFGNTGGAIVNMVSKSGTNEVHGVGYEFSPELVAQRQQLFQ